MPASTTSDTDNEDIEPLVVCHRPILVSAPDSPVLSGSIAHRNKVSRAHFCTRTSGSEHGIVPYNGDLTASSGPSRSRRRRRDADEDSRRMKDYLERVDVPSNVVDAANRNPLVILCLESVILCAQKSGSRRWETNGSTSFIKRPYLDTLLEFILSPDSPWCLAFSSDQPRSTALAALKQLGLPIGQPYAWQRITRVSSPDHGSPHVPPSKVVGLFTKEDLYVGWCGLDRGLKDLGSIWSALDHEIGRSWGPETTVMISDDAEFVRAQPFNHVCVPHFRYDLSTDHDESMLMMISVLKDLETESNFAYHIREMGWTEEGYFGSPLDEAEEAFPDKKSVEKRRDRMFHVQSAVRICAEERITIVGFRD